MVLYTVLKIAAVLALTLIGMDRAAAIPMVPKAQLTGEGVEQKDCDTKGVRSQSTLGMLGGLIQKASMFSSTGKSPFVEQSRSGSGRVYAPIGRIETNQAVPWGKKMTKLESTTFLVAPCYAITNHHAVFGQSKKPEALAKTATFTMSFERDGASYVDPNAKIADGIYGQYHKTNNRSHDWALVHLPSCPGEKIGWMKIAKSVTDDDMTNKAGFNIAGFPEGHSSSKLWAQKNCEMKGRDTNSTQIGTWLTSCSVASGNSGSPIFKDKDGKPEVVALAAADYNGSEQVKTTWTKEESNLAIPIRSFWSQIALKVGTDQARLKHVNPAFDPTIILGSK